MNWPRPRGEKSVAGANRGSHNYKGKRYENMLFGDIHVENYKFPPQMDQWGSIAPDPKFTWW